MASVAPDDTGLYVHIPFCVRKCGYCAFYSVALAQRHPQPLIDAIAGELELIAPTEPVRTLYIGGGSPTCLPGDVLCELIASLTRRFDLPDEITVECNPAQADADLLRSLFQCGVTRLSVGAQSFDPDELSVLGRLHSPQAIEQVVDLARQAGFVNIGLDLIFAIPGSTVETFCQSLNRAVALAPTHLSAYSLTWEPHTPLTAALNDGRIRPVSEDDERAMYRQLSHRLAEAGYRQYEISNFARGGYECWHNLRYWHNRPVIGLGPAASGWYRRQRTTNIADIDGYIEYIRAGRLPHASLEQPDPLQIASETAILALRTTDGIDLHTFAGDTGYDALCLFAKAVAEHEFAGLLERTDTHLRLTETGRSYADTVACDFVFP